MKRDTWCIIISLLCLTRLFAMAMRPEPRPDYIPVSSEIKKVMKINGVWALECRGKFCTFQRDGQTIKIRL